MSTTTVTGPYTVRRTSSLRRTTVVAGLVATDIVIPALVRHAHD